MSPREALKRMAAPFAPQRTQPSFTSKELSGAHQRLADIMAEVAAIQIGDRFPQQRALPRRDVAEALRWFLFTDLLALAFGFVAAWAAAAVTNSVFLDRDFPGLLGWEEARRVGEFALVGIGVLVWFWHRGHYRMRKPFWLEAHQVVGAFAFAMLVDGFLQFAAKQDLSRLWLMAGWGVAALSVIVLRGVVRRFMRRRGIWQIRTLLVGGGPVAEEARAALRSEPGLGYEVVMQIENLPLLLEQAGNSWEKLCDRFSADYVVIALDSKALAEAEMPIARLVREGIPFSVSPPLRHLPVLGMTPQYFFNHDVMLMTHSSNLEMPLPRFLKRSIDVIGSGLGLLALSPLMLGLAYLVRRDGGPVFFGDIRIGLDGKPFYCLKFRSMVMNGDEVFKKYLEENPDKKREWMKFHKLRDFDPRVTKVGAFMRKWSIDELPQLINVFRGDMSLVGPRPIMFRERNAYNEGMIHYSRVRPGLTGLWQVSGRSDVSFERRVEMDGWYVRNWSLWHDIAILCKTVPAILKKTGAY